MMKTRLGRRLSAAVMGMITMMAVAASKEAELKVQAAELPVVKQLEVAASPDKEGVVARCSYQNYTDQSGCEMRLYLYKIEDDRELIETQKVLAYAEWGSESTEPVQVTEGVYRASVSIDNKIEIKQINSQSYYRIKQVDGKYEVSEEAVNESLMWVSDQQENEAGSGCSHSYEVVLVQQATPVTDAVQALQCEKCGAVREYIEVPNSAYAAFLKEAEALIQNAPQGETVVISTERWMSFNRKVLETIKDRPDLTVVVNYQYQKENCLLIIPAGANVDLLMDESGFSGFRYIEEIL